MMVAASAAAVGAAVAAAAFVVQRRNIQKKRRVGRAHANACYSRRSLLHPRQENAQTPWRVLLGQGDDASFEISTKFTRSVFMTHLHPAFHHERELYNWGSPFRRGPKIRGLRAYMRSVDLLGLCLWY